jgi:methylated-DNA-[protein]-cysteine S-methyltransferase
VQTHHLSIVFVLKRKSKQFLLRIRENMTNFYIYTSSLIGDILIKDNGSAITEILFYKKDNYLLKDEEVEKETPLIKEAFWQLSEYFEGNRRTFDLPLYLEGTEFQKKVWNALYTIPFGETRSYKEIASSVGNYKASRAIGNANNKNPIPIVIPCHRVIGANGKMVGYAGGLDIKMKLLELEGYHPKL